MFEQQKLDIERTCRTCKNECDGNRSIFSAYLDNSSHIHEMLMTFADVQVGYGDGLPNTICELCLVQLHSAYIFKIQCENVDKALREYVKNMIEKDIKPDVFNLNGSNVQNSNDISSASTLEDVDNKNKQSEIHGNKISLVDTEAGLVASNDYIQILENNQLLLTCPECGKSFTTAKGLKCHKRIHSGLSFKSKSCDKKFSRQNHLLRHELTLSRKKVCRICKKTFTRLENLKRHLFTHLREKPYPCPRCKKGFNREEILDNHMVRCKGDRIHICDICNKGFNSDESLEVHRSVHINQEPVLPTIENLDNIEDHYYEIDYDASTTFSDNSDDMEEYFEPHVEVTESNDEKKIKEVTNLGEDIYNNSLQLETQIDVKPVIMSNMSEDITENLITISTNDTALKKNNSNQEDVENFERHLEHAESIHENKIKEEPNLGEDSISSSEQLYYPIYVKPLIMSNMSEDEVDVKENIITISTNNTEDTEINRDEDNSDLEDVDDFQGDYDDINDDEFLVPVEEDSEDEEYKLIPEPAKRRKGRSRKNSIEKVSANKSPQKQNKNEEKMCKVPCPFCTEIFSQSSELQKHAFDKHPEISKKSQPKPRKKRGSTWDEDSLRRAMEAVQNNQLNTNAAALKFNIPRRTLRNHLTSGNSTKIIGKTTILTKQFEEDFSHRIKRFAKLGIPLTPTFIRKQAFLFCERFEIKHSFNMSTRMAGRKWLKMFLSRNPSISKRKPQLMNQKHNFQEMKKLYDELDIVKHPERLYNMDAKECRITVHKQNVDLGEKGNTKVDLIAPEHAENVTIAMCVNAIGVAIPPMIIFKGIRRRSELALNLPSGTKISMEPKGSMTSSLFVEFIQHLAQYKVPGKCLLIFDGAKCHLSYEALEKADKNDIVLYCLPLNKAHKLQPLDKSVSQSFEHHWDEEVLNYIYISQERTLNKAAFNKIFSRTWPKCMTQTNITKGFKAAGLYPLDLDVKLEDAYASSIVTPRRKPARFSYSSSTDASGLELDLMDNDQYQVEADTKHDHQPSLHDNPFPSTSDLQQNIFSTSSESDHHLHLSE